MEMTLCDASHKEHNLITECKILDMGLNSSVLFPLYKFTFFASCVCLSCNSLCDLVVQSAE